MEGRISQNCYIACSFCYSMENAIKKITTFYPIFDIEYNTWPTKKSDLPGWTPFENPIQSIRAKMRHQYSEINSNKISFYSYFL